MVVTPVVPADRFNTWRVLGERGISSDAIMDHLTGKDRDGTCCDYPRDAGDFRRCEELLQAVPEAREHLDVVAARSPQWAAVIGQWDRLAQLLASGHWNELTRSVGHLVDEASTSTMVVPPVVAATGRRTKAGVPVSGVGDRIDTTDTATAADLLDALPAGSLVRTHGTTVYEAFDDPDADTTNARLWFAPGLPSPVPTRFIAHWGNTGPRGLTVLHVPDAAACVTCDVEKPLSMIEYRVTVGVQYGPSWPHPHLPGLTGDHYVAVVAGEMDEARRLAVAVLGTAWSFIYEPGDHPEERHTPAGCYATVALTIH